jgi:hypothetical protein
MIKINTNTEMTQLYDNNHYNSVDRCDKYSTDDKKIMNEFINN